MTDSLAMNALLETAVAHFERKEIDQADTLCAEILATAPSAAALHLRGLIAISRRDYVQAADHLSAATAMAPDDPDIHLRLGGVLLALEDRERASAVTEKAVALKPGDREAHLYLAQARLLEKRFDEANVAALRALALSPEWPRALEVLALIAFENGKRERALQLAERALMRESRSAVAHRVIADVHVHRKNYQAARAHYEAALHIEPKQGRTLSHYALFLNRTGEAEMAVETYQKSLRYLPGDVAAQHGLSQVLLALGRLSEGWPLYRQRRVVQKLAPRHPDLPLLERLPQTGERVLAWMDEGVGDQIMWASLLPDLVQIGAELVVECDPRLVPLLARSFPQVDFMPWDEPRAPIPGARPSAHFSLSDHAAIWLRDRFEKFHAQGYLLPPERRFQDLRAKYRRQRPAAPVIGISWKTADGGKITGEKTLALAQWGPLLHMPGATFVNLQYGQCAEEIADTEKKFGIRITCDAGIDPVEDLDAFAAQVAAMDLVITTSNATAHVAGALGIPTWVLVPKGFGGLWHWFLNRDDSPWYPAVRIFRQTTQGDWEPVIAAASEALVEFVGTQPLPSRP